ncbi:MAG: DUF2284 domain-containing protein [Treponema sp.]|nr:DUF2284 domain-containing protein [Treponema sp.]
MIDLLIRISKTINVPVCEHAEVPVVELVFLPGLLDYCKTNVCGNYNKSWTCPPACRSIEEQREKILFYKNVLVFSTKHNIEDSFDYDGMTKGRELHTLLTGKLKQQLGDVPVYGAGSCPVCLDKEGKHSCSFPKPCMFPEKRIGSIEAAGIDVTELCKAAGINYNNGPNTVTFFTIVLQ